VTDLLASGFAWLRGQREQHMATAVSYRGAGGVLVGTVTTATLGRTTFRFTDDYGQSVRIVSADFIISADDLPDEPQPGDLIERNGQAYEVTNINGEPCWRWTDSYHGSRRIHTQHIGTYP
jgi:hypothetical protein